MTRFAWAASYELVMVLVIIISATAGFYAPEIGTWLMTVTDLG